MSKNLDLGNKIAFQKLYNDMYSGLKYFASQLLTSEAEADDIIQEVWIKLWTKQPVFDHLSQLKSYVYQSVRNAALNHLRDTQRQQHVLQNIPQESVEQDISEKIIEAEVYAIINKTFTQVSESAKRVYIAKLNGKKYKEIAEEFDISVNTVKKHINNVNKFLKEHVKPLLEFIVHLMCV